MKVRDSIISIVYALFLGEYRIWIPVSTRDFSLLYTRPDRPWGPPIHPYNGTSMSFPGEKRPGLGVLHPPPHGAEVKYGRAVQLLPFCAPIDTFWVDLYLTILPSLYIPCWYNIILYIPDWYQLTARLFHASISWICRVFQVNISCCSQYIPC